MDPDRWTKSHFNGGRHFLLRVETSSEAADYAKYDRLRNAVWDYPEDHLAGTRNLMCENFLHDGGSLFLAAYAADPDGRVVEDEAHLAGFSYGFVGIKDKAAAFRALDNLWFYSQYTAVRPEYQGFGLGVALKEFQREILTGVLGIFTVVCTYDPLTGVNAYRNIRHFGMRVLEYRAAVYGEYGGRLNRLDVPTDRFFMSWDLRAAPGRPGYDPGDLPALGTPVLKTERRSVRGRTRSLEIETATGLDLSPGGEYVRVRIPRDFYEILQETDVEDPEVRRIPLDWRLKTREAFQTLFRRGYRIVDFRQIGRPVPENDYLLKRD